MEFSKFSSWMVGPEQGWRKASGPCIHLQSWRPSGGLQLPVTLKTHLWCTPEHLSSILIVRKEYSLSECLGLSTCWWYLNIVHSFPCLKPLRSRMHSLPRLRQTGYSRWYCSATVSFHRYQLTCTSHLQETQHHSGGLSLAVWDP